jgi:membrane protease YdiL (CAAX protease family)
MHHESYGATMVGAEIICAKNEAWQMSYLRGYLDTVTIRWCGSLGSPDLLYGVLHFPTLGFFMGYLLAFGWWWSGRRQSSEYYPASLFISMVLAALTLMACW